MAACSRFSSLLPFTVGISVFNSQIVDIVNVAFWKLLQQLLICFKEMG